MTPSAAMGMRNSNETTSGSPANLLTSISSQGNPEAANMEQSQQPIQQNPVEQFLSNFSQAVNSLKPLLEDPNYSFAKKEADLVRRSLENYMEAITTGLSVQSQGGGESFGATPSQY